MYCKLNRQPAVKCEAFANTIENQFNNSEQFANTFVYTLIDYRIFIARWPYITFMRWEWGNRT